MIMKKLLLNKLNKKKKKLRSKNELNKSKN